MVASLDFDHAFYEDYGQWWGVPGGVTTDISGSTGATTTDPHQLSAVPRPAPPWHGKRLHERWLVQEYDRYRAEPHVGANEEMLDLLRGDITLARKRVWYMAHFDPKTGHRNATPAWNLYNRGWRWQELLRRSRGERVV